ncbi:MAG: hypothetical protein H6838_02015 [Planctomycetes bacterium]|nr:hypothetical protein [Planctomycetota bacterium]MCB9884234.1 hypothetical protein [Planctomycetota bacterium]
MSRSLCRSLLISCAMVFAAPAQERTLQEEINHTLDEARPALLTHLRKVGHGNNRPGLVALVLLAAIHDGVGEDEPRFTKALEVLTASDPDECYDLALRLLVFEALPHTAERTKLAKRDLGRLLRRQTSKGGFHYQENSNHWDLSNTQYAALGLRAAVALGLDVDKRVWTDMAKAVRDLQDNYGGFGYSPGGATDTRLSYASMTAAGIAALAICQQQLGEKSRVGKSLDKEIGRGWQWFERNVATIGSLNERRCFYFHYGLERAGILCDVEKVGEVSWYERGAKMFIAAQMASGGWTSAQDGVMGMVADAAGDPVATSFAILFLRRKFQKQVGAVTQYVVRFVNLGPHSPDKDVEACAEQLVAQGKEVMPDVLKALRSKIEPQRRAAAAALQGIAGETFGYDAAKDADGNLAAVRAAELWYLRNR